MNLLLVDDQPYVISALRSGIDWEALGVTQVFTALNAMDAKAIITKQTIDILLSDIEMPVENGLSLLRWCRKEGYQFECIFLTSYADFFYAQEALQLGSVDYLLKPVRYEDLEKVLQKTIHRIQDKKKELTLTGYGKAVLSQKSSFLKSVLQDWFEGNDNNITQKLDTLQDMGFFLSCDTQVYLIKIQILSWKGEPLLHSAWYPRAESILSEFFHHNHYTALSYCPDKLCVNTLLYSDTDSNFATEVYKTKLSILFSHIQKTLNCSIALYSAPAVPFHRLPYCADMLRKELADNVLAQPGLHFRMPQSTTSNIYYCDPELLKHFELQLANHNSAQVYEEACFFLCELSEKKQLNHATLSAFCRDFELTAMQAANILGLDIHTLPTRSDDSSANHFTPLTLEAAALYLKSITDYFHLMESRPDNKDHNLLRISNYVRQNIDKPLRCSEIAKAVFLSPDYVTRLLQKERGLSLKEYVTLEKMKVAQDLLINTQLSISAVAVKVGYDNFSHFSQVYKRVLGITPSEQRSHSVS